MENESSSDGYRLPSNKYSCPWLMISHYALEQQTFYNIIEDRSYCAKMIPDILQKFPISTNQPGWVLVQGDRSCMLDDEEEDDADDGDHSEDDEVDGGDNSDEDDDGDVDEEDNYVSDGDGDGYEEDGQEYDDGDGDEFGDEDEYGDEVGHGDDDFGSAEEAEECDDESRVICFLWNITSSSSEKIPIADYKGVTDTTSYYDRCLLSPFAGESDYFIYLFKKTSIFFGRLSNHILSHRVVMGDDNVPMMGAVIAENSKVFCIFGNMEVVIGTPIYKEGWCLDLTRYRTNYGIDRPLGTNSSYSYFIEYQGEVIYLMMSMHGASYFHHVHSFWVYRFHSKKKTWELLDDIGQTAIFITDMDFPTGFGIRSKVSNEDEKKGLRPNSIYFTLSSKFIYIYSLEDQTISYFCPCPIVTNYHLQWVLF